MHEVRTLNPIGTWGNSSSSDDKHSTTSKNKQRREDSDRGRRGRESEEGSRCVVGERAVEYDASSGRSVSKWMVSPPGRSVHTAEHQPHGFEWAAKIAAAPLSIPTGSTLVYCRTILVKGDRRASPLVIRDCACYALATSSSRRLHSILIKSFGFSILPLLELPALVAAKLPMFQRRDTELCNLLLLWFRLNYQEKKLTQSRQVEFKPPWLRQ
ncbi:hypothetical protein TEQG_01569 [Trichophyton equinum CBS 127.97]|uniref:Uncharacterized protein n=1 Tax=Trichophyton equinum (strain ATCC MYA-4606 / CBS 127.97) TaxID=559882 RepID=F2PLH0_TRIEC|nr:hypothetical protein TEQG_01569 [Trichophyton equinum CBS 127.97]